MSNIIEVNVPDAPGSPVEIDFPISKETVVIVTGNHNGLAKVGIKLTKDLRLLDLIAFCYKQGGNGNGQCIIYDKNDNIVGAISSADGLHFSTKLADNWYGW